MTAISEFFDAHRELIEDEPENTELTVVTQNFDQTFNQLQLVLTTASERFIAFYEYPRAVFIFDRGIVVIDLNMDTNVYPLMRVHGSVPDVVTSPEFVSAVEAPQLTA